MGVRGYFLDFYSLRNSSLGNSSFGILEFPSLSLRESKATEAISRNSRFCLGILEFLSRDPRVKPEDDTRLREF